jgi:2,3-bisphosphoglycerate-independent phosphoglycerate mutase
MEALDLQIGRLLKAIDEVGGVAIFTADHGNADEMFELDKKTKLPSKKAKTSHTLNPVPCIFYDNVSGNTYSVEEGAYGLSNLAATVVNLLGYEAPDMWDASMIKIL